MWVRLKKWILSWVSGWEEFDDSSDWLVQTLFNMSGMTVQVRDRTMKGVPRVLYTVHGGGSTMHTYFQVYSSRGVSLKGRVALVYESYVSRGVSKTVWLYEIRVVYDGCEVDVVTVVCPHEPDTNASDWEHVYKSVVMQTLHARMDQYGIGRIGQVMHPVMWYPAGTHSPVHSWDTPF